MSTWTWAEALARRDFWRLLCRSDEPLEDQALAHELFSAGHTIQLQLARTHTWTISFGPRGSIAHALDELDLGADDAHASLPILRLAEVRAIACAWTGGDVPALYVPLLLYPVAGLSSDELALARADVHASKVATAIDLVIEALEAMPPAQWQKDPAYGWITDGEDSFRNPHGVHYGSAWRELAKATGNPRHWAQADAIAAAAWRVDREFARIAAFFDDLGVH